MSAAHLFAHQHGGAPAGKEGLLDFSVNVSPIPLPMPSDPLHSFNLGSYPSMDGKGVREFYAGRFGFDEKHVMPLNGAIEGIYLLPRALGLKRVLIPKPSFHDYSRACRLAGAEVVGLFLEPETGFAFPDIETVADALDGCDALCVGNPNNPTGTMISKAQLLALACRFPEKIFIVDEAFIQFTEGFPDNSLMFDSMAFRNIVVIHSLTKFYALPGLRLGAVVAHSGMIRRLYGHKEPWTVNAIAESVARHLLECHCYEEHLFEMVSSGRRLIAEALSGHDTMKLYGGTANFFLASIEPESEPESFFPQLEARGIFVRDCRNFDGLDRNWFRFSIRGREDNLRLVESLRAVLPCLAGGVK